MKMEYRRTKEFEKDLKKLVKKFRTLRDDLKVAQKSAIELFHLHNIDNSSIFEITDVGSNKDISFYVLKKFACKSIKGKGARSGIRITYAYIPKDNIVVYIEIYFKGKKEIEDKERIIKVREEIEGELL